jgi:hypothetical protein
MSNMETYVPPCEDATAREEIRKHNELVDRQWDTNVLHRFVSRNPIPGVSEDRLLSAVQALARSMGRISECCLICGHEDVTLYAHYAGRFCKDHYDEGMRREEELDKITCSQCEGTFKHADLEHGLCGSCMYEFNNGK